MPQATKPSLRSGGLLPFLLEVAANNHKTQGKEAEEEGRIPPVRGRFGC